MRSHIITRDEDKRELIERLSNEGADLALFCDDLAEALPNSIEARESVSIVRAPYNFDELERSWYYGNWCLIHPANIDFSPIDTFRSPSAKIDQAMRSYGVTLLIDSFHDNIEWKVHENA